MKATLIITGEKNIRQMTGAIIILSLSLLMVTGLFISISMVAIKYKKLYEQSCREYQDLMRANKSLLKAMERERSSIDERLTHEVNESVKEALKQRNN